jgi:predicted nucleic acid-binding Zn ribbon protein
VAHSKGFRRRKDPRSDRPVALGDVLDELLAEEPFRPGLPIATLRRTWPSLLGERLGSATTPVSLDAGVLVVRAADDPWGAQAKYLADEIRTRADAALGGGVVQSVRIVVGEPRNRRSEG